MTITDEMVERFYEQVQNKTSMARLLHPKCQYRIRPFNAPVREGR